MAKLAQVKPRILEIVKEGPWQSLRDIAGRVGVNETTLRDWLRRGRQGFHDSRNKKYTEFCMEFEEAKAGVIRELYERALDGDAPAMSLLRHHSRAEEQCNRALYLELQCDLMRKRIAELTREKTAPTPVPVYVVPPTPGTTGKP